MSEPRGGSARESLLAGVGALHRAVDEQIHALVGRLPACLPCGPGCADCCPADLTVLEVEAEWIRCGVGEGLRGETPAATGCAFLDRTLRCRIYPYRPYVCQTHGLPLTWFEEDEQGSIQEPRAGCEHHPPAFRLAELQPAQVWLLGPHEARLVELEEAWDRREVRRQELGALFRALAEGLMPDRCVER